jgi:hypothetical protein
MTNIRRDITDQRDNKFREACDYVQEQYNDRWPARGRANQAAREWRPLDQISRDGKPAEYRKWPSAR